jgi:polysaccharide export outer membrane protein
LKLLFLQGAGFLLSVLMLTSCSSYKQNIMFKVPDGHALQTQADNTEHNYVIQANDKLRLEVFTNAGERIIDPNSESTITSTGEKETQKPVLEYPVNNIGIVKFPLIGELKVAGLTLHEAEDILQKEYSKYYQQPYVVLQYTNKRVVILGSPGGQIVPLTNQSVKLTEVLAMAKGIDQYGKSHNIRVLRGDQVFVVDLSTVDGYLKSNMIIEPNDIIYVEPVRRPFSEGLRDYGPIFSILASFSTLFIVLLK